ncbi:MAG: putative transporter ATP-binding protein [Planctomycetaceae bacterium]|nr:putative transporter ATP-binding protein [Planctomycetaceae bacterium]
MIETQPQLKPLLELEGVSRLFGTQVVLSAVNLQVFQGETLVVIGESGCGKSVTLRMLCGLLTPTSGKVRFEGLSWSERPERNRRNEQLRFGFLFQGAALFDSMNVFENVAFGLRQNTVLKADQIEQIVRERLNEVGLPFSVCEKKPAQLSGGMKKRVALARALALTPEIMLYDEPTTGLDPVMTDVINELILQTRRARTITSIVVTHDMSTVKKVADRVVMLHPAARLAEGEQQVIFEGPAAAAFASPDARVSQFVKGEAGARLREMALAG